MIVSAISAGSVVDYGRVIGLLTSVAMALVAAGCARDQPPPLFDRLDPAATGVTFVNELPETPEINIINYLNYYNGGGVAVGDVDGDGFQDLYFTSNLGSDRLYRNLGDFRFEDVTERAGVGGARGWKSGVTMADVNGDGHVDIYVSTVSHLTLRGRNVLFINDGDGTFTDRTAEFGLEHAGYSTQAAFFDYDGDGDLDMYLLNHSTHAIRGSTWNPERQVRSPEAGDRLFRNDGGRFVDVSEAAGIYGGVSGYGLGVVASDLNLDGCPDLYVANDFDENDFLYLNDCDGTFTEAVGTAMGHTSRSSMGVDAADYNNDGRPDVIVLDMLPEREEILQTSHNADDFTVHHMKLRAGYHPQYARNTLQLNRGTGRFSEIGYLAGVYATDWSWAPLFADLDDDGYKDLFVTNGIHRRPNDLDYISYVADRRVQAALLDTITADLLGTVLDEMPQVPIPNYAFRNNGDLTFSNVTREWALAEPGFSTGATYVDLDNDGALDLVVNNVNAVAGIYRNRAREISGNHSLTVRLRGSGANTAGFGAKVIIEHGGMTQWLEQSPTRGFQSSVDPRLHFGLGASQQVDSLTVIWPDRRFEVLTAVAADQMIELSQEDAAGRYDYDAGNGGLQPRERQQRQEGQEGQQRPETWTGFFEDVTSSVSIDYTHRENTFFDYNREPLIPHKLSTEGPALAVGDVDGDGLDDVYIGGAKWQAGRLFLQRRDGTFRPINDAVFRADSLAEDVDAAFFDANGDGFLDLYVVSGGNEFWGDAEALRDRLYVNDGRGGLRRAPDALPAFFENGCCVAPGDFNADGYPDLFVGSRVVSRNYGLTPRSYLLQNDGAGRFTDVTDAVAPELVEAGMVSSGAWVDYDADGQLDLVVTGEWMPIRVFRQEDGRFVDRTSEAGFAGTNGWWNSVTVADLRGTGRPDLILGNLGLNSYVTASPAQPARLYVHDFAENGSVQQILTFSRTGVSYPLAGRDELIRAIPRLRDRYPTYASFGASRIEDIFGTAELREARVLEAYRFASAVALNNGDGSFAVHALPMEAQFAPIYAALAGDFTGDGHADLIVGGNFHGVPPVRGQYDASYGLLLRGDGTGRFVAVDMEESRLIIEGEVRKMQLLRSVDGPVIVVARNNEASRFLRLLMLDPH